MFDAEYSEEFLKSVEKLAKKDRLLALEVHNKISQILSSNQVSIQHYKNLQGPLKTYKRVHVGSFVLLFKLEENTVYFERFDHHDNIYDSK